MNLNGILIEWSLLALVGLVALVVLVAAIWDARRRAR